ATGVVGKAGWVEVELIGDKGQHLGRWPLALQQRSAGKSAITRHDGKLEPVRLSAPPVDQCAILGAERVSSARSFVTELTRWGRSMLDLLHTLQDLQAWDVSLVAQTRLQVDLRSAQGKLIASLMAALAEFERDLLRERVRSGIAAARKRGVMFGRR